MYALHVLMDMVSSIIHALLAMITSVNYAPKITQIVHFVSHVSEFPVLHALHVVIPSVKYVDWIQPYAMNVRRVMA